jgi:hypothetical protein
MAGQFSVIESGSFRTNWMFLGLVCGAAKLASWRIGGGGE